MKSQYRNEAAAQPLFLWGLLSHEGLVSHNKHNKMTFDRPAELRMADHFETVLQTEPNYYFGWQTASMFTVWLSCTVAVMAERQRSFLFYYQPYLDSEATKGRFQQRLYFTVCVTIVCSKTQDLGNIFWCHKVKAYCDSYSAWPADKCFGYFWMYLLLQLWYAQHICCVWVDFTVNVEIRFQ